MHPSFRIIAFLTYGHYARCRLKTGLHSVAVFMETVNTKINNNNDNNNIIVNNNNNNNNNNLITNNDDDD